MDNLVVMLDLQAAGVDSTRAGQALELVFITINIQQEHMFWDRSGLSPGGLRLRECD